MRKLYISPQKKIKMIGYFLYHGAWSIVYWLLKSHCFEFVGGGKYGLSLAKNLMEIWYLLSIEKFLFWLFREWEIWSFLREKVSEKMIFTGYWKVLVLSFSVLGNTVFFARKKLMERWYLLVTEKFLFWATGKFLFWAFRWWEIRAFLSQKVDVKVEISMIFQDLGNTVFRAVIGLLKYRTSADSNEKQICCHNRNKKSMLFNKLLSVKKQSAGNTIIFEIENIIEETNNHEINCYKVINKLN